jgi:hypothetical protein
MKIIISIIIILLSNLSLFSQDINWEISRKDFLNNSKLIDTVIQFYYHTDSTIKEKRVLQETEHNDKSITSVKHLFLMKRYLYNKDGHLIQEGHYNKGLYLKGFTYDQNGLISTEETFNYNNPDECFFNLKYELLFSKQFKLTTQLAYENGNISHKFFYKNHKREGNWEYYDKQTGKLKKIKRYSNGKRILIEKFE